MGYCMRSFGHTSSTASFRTKPSVFLLGLASLLVAGACTALHAQTAPYVLPYTISTYAGGNPQYTIGASCASGGIALDAAGDGCLALNGSINGDPHDVRVDARGNVYFLDDTTTASAVLHRVNPFTQLQTIFAGNLVGNKVCTPNFTKYGDGCPANDGVANDNPSVLTTLLLKASRGIGTANNGNVLISGYNDYYEHVILASTGYMQQLGGTGVTGTADGPIGTSQVGQSRGIGSDPTGTVTYIADTNNSRLRQIYNGTMSTLTAANTSNTKVVVNNTGIANEQLDGPEDVQTDSYGNVYISDTSDGVILAIYKAGTLPGIPTSSLVVNNVYTIVGYFSGSSVANPFTYPSPPYANGIAPAYPATTVSIGTPRKFSIDSHNNLYIADSTNNVVWFLDAATANLRIIAGNFGATAGTPAPGCAASSNTFGDGCPATLASFYANPSNTDLAAAPDTQGNLFISDSEGGQSALSRIRKQLSGLAFPATTFGSSVTQTVQLHFAPNDAPASTKPYALAAKGTDFSLGTPTCNPTNNDSTTDCLLPITFTPSQSGYDTATLTVTSANGGVGTYLVNGQGNASSIAFDPGNTSLLAPSIKNAQGIVLDGAGNSYIADTGNNRILFVSATTGTTTTFAGGASTVCSAHTDSFGDGCPAAQATLNAPKAVAIDTAGNIFIADTGNNLIRKVSPSTGLITLYGGGAAASIAGGTCAGLTASITNPIASAFDALGNGCPATLAKFTAPSGLAADNLGSIYVSDTGSNTIRVIASNGYVSSLAGGAAAICAAPASGSTTGASDSLGDGCASTATIFNAPTGLAFDNVNKALLVADTGDSDVRRISLGTNFTVAANIATNVEVQPVTLVAGNGQPGTSIGGSGVAANSQLSSPTGVAVDPAGNVYIADTGNNSVRLVNASTGVISTIVGINGVGGTGSLAGTVAPITAFQITSNEATFTAANTLTAGQLVTIAGLTSTVGKTLDGQTLTVLANSLSTTQFSATVTAANAPLTVDSGTATVSSSTATLTQLASPGGLAVTPLGTLLILDSGNNRVLSDSRSAVSYNFGITGITLSSPVANFSELNIGNASVTTLAFAQTVANSRFTLTNAANPSGSIAACGTSLAPGAICNLAAQFTPTGTGTQTVAYTQTITPTLPTGVPTINLAGSGAVLTTTTGSVAQTSPVPPINAQYGTSLTVSATITPSSCNLAAPACSPANNANNLSFIVDGTPLGALTTTTSGNSAVASQVLTGLSVGPHNVSCSFAGDTYYAPVTCATTIVTIAQAGTASSLAVTNNNQVQFDNCTASGINIQCGTTVLTAAVSSTTVGTPTGSVTFSASGKYLPLNAANTPTTVALGSSGTASLTLAELLGAGTIQNGPGVSTGIEVSNTTLPPGVYTLTCNYLGATNYAPSACTGITFTVLPSPASASIIATRGCSIAVLSVSFTQTPTDTNACNGEQFLNGSPEVSVAQGSTTDASVFIQPTNTLSGTMTFSCTGLPANSICTFSPTSIALTPSTAHIAPVYVDVTLWTDLQYHSQLQSPTLGKGRPGILLAEMLGWPLTLIGFAGLLLSRRKLRHLRGLALVAVFSLMAGTSLTLTGCAGPGVYSAVLTAPGVYPITVTATDGSVTASTLVYFNVTSPGIPGQESVKGSGK
jgi:sugar lactone lactonase YvrE